MSRSARARGSSRASIRTATQVESSPKESEFEKATAASSIRSISASGSSGRSSDTLGQPLYAEQLAGAIPGFRQAIRVEEQDVAGMQRDPDLTVDLTLADPQRQVLPLQQGAGPRARLVMNRRLCGHSPRSRRDGSSDRSGRSTR